MFVRGRSGGSEAHRDKMRRIPLFADLGDDEIDLLDATLTEAGVDAGKRLTAQGEVGREFVVILDGLAAVVHSGLEVARLGPYDFFGEHALIQHDRRTADVVALTPMRLLVSTPGEFDRMLDDVPRIRERVTAADRARQDSTTSRSARPGPAPPAR